MQAMKLLTLPFAAVGAATLWLGACSSRSPVAEDAKAPPLNVMTETPGEWSELDDMVGRTPPESGLFEKSPIITDLDALLGPDATAFKRVAARGSALTRAGDELVTIAADRSAFLTIQPGDHALQAGMKRDGRWQVWTTPAAKVPQPAAVQALLKS